MCIRDSCTIIESTHWLRNCVYFDSLYVLAMLFTEKVNRILDFNQQLIEKFSAYTNRRVAKKSEIHYSCILICSDLLSISPDPPRSYVTGRRLEAVRRLSDCGNKLLSASS